MTDTPKMHAMKERRLRYRLSLYLQELRGERGINQQTLADLLGVSRRCISEIENGRRDVSIYMLRQFSVIFKKSMERLTGFDKVEEKE